MNDGEDDHRVKPLSRVETTRAEWGGGLRIWVASKPLIDTTEEPDHGTTGYHLHTYASKEDRKVGKKVIDDTFETIILDGVEVCVYCIEMASVVPPARCGICGDPITTENDGGCMELDSRRTKACMECRDK